MADLMRLQPAVFGFGDCIINQDAFVIGEIQRPQIKFLDRLKQQRGPMENLPATAFQLADHRLEQPICFAGEIMPIQLQERPHILQPQGWFRVAQLAQQLIGPGLNVLPHPRF